MKLLSVKPEQFSPTEYRRPKTHGRICVFDTETDPFAYGSSIKPFTCGFYDGETYVDFWGDDCIDQFARYILSRSEERLLIYAHNLGGFDIHFLYDYFDEGKQPLIIGSRVVKMNILGQEFRDSLKIIPVPLRAYQKDEFDYSKNTREKREDCKEEIREYQKHDCFYLYDLVKEFHEEFGNRITVGNAAINMLKSFYGFHTLNAKQDESMRPFFFGGRNQCLENGVLDDEWNVYDVNSMYPYVMKAYRHPISGYTHRGKYITEDTYFAEIVAWNNGCLPIRGSDGDLDFTCKFGTFFASIHEINAGLEIGDLRIKKVIRTVDMYQATDFSAFIDHFYDLRLKAKANGDRIRDLFYKLILNNAYGKFAQNPLGYQDYTITLASELPDAGMYHKEANPNGWEPKFINGSRIIWARGTGNRRPNFFNVATGASITGAARTELYRGLRLADRPVYCDTDSIICRSIRTRLSESEIGGWKLEASGTRVAIAGKKMYALFDADGNVIKKASKGAQLSGENILRVAEGETVKYQHIVPTFGLNGSVTYLERYIQRTGEHD